MNAAMKKTTGKGRKPLSPLEKASRRVVKAYSELTEVEREFNLILGLSNPQKPTRQDEELIANAERRIEINKRLNQVIAEVMPLSRKKRKSQEEKDRMNELREERAELYQTLKDLPELGVTEEEWSDIPAEDKAMDIGRPKVSLELRLVRARIEYKEAEKEYRKEEKAAGQDPIDIPTLAKKKRNASGAAGRPSGGELTELDKSLKLIRKKIDYVESGQATADMLEKEKKRKRTPNGEKMGRPFEDPAKKLQKYKEEEASILNRIAEVESQLSDEEWLQRQINVKRKEIKRQNKVLLEQNLDPEHDSNEPEVKQLYKLEAELYKLEDKREELLQGTSPLIQREESRQTKGSFEMERAAHLASLEQSRENAREKTRETSQEKVRAIETEHLKDVLKKQRAV